MPFRRRLQLHMCSCVLSRGVIKCVYVCVRRACCPPLDFPGHLILCPCSVNWRMRGNSFDALQGRSMHRNWMQPKVSCLYLNVSADPRQLDRTHPVAVSSVPDPLLRPWFLISSSLRSLCGQPPSHACYAIQIPLLVDTRNFLDPLLVNCMVTKANKELNITQSI